MRKFLLVLTLGLVPAASQAAYYCADPEVVNRQADGDCMNNEFVSEAAVLCLEKLEKEIETGKAGVSSASAKHSIQSKSSQADREKNAALDYNFSRETLDLLIAHAKEAQEEVIHFDKDQLVYPEDYDEPEVTGMDTATYLKNTPCYGENHEVISNVLEDFDYYISDLEHARDLANDLTGASTKNAHNLSGKKSPGFDRSSPNQSSGRATKNWRSSDISGTKDKKK